MRMVEQNGGKFRRLKKNQKIAFLRNQKIPGNVIAWYVDLDEKVKKIHYGHFISKKKEPEK